MNFFLECKTVDEQPQENANSTLPDDDAEPKPGNSKTKKFVCDVCTKKMYLTSIDILKHKKTCK